MPRHCLNRRATPHAYVGGDSLQMLMGAQVTDLSAGAPVLRSRGVHFDLTAGAYLTPEALCVAGVAVPLLRGYFNRPSGGG